MPQRLRDAEFLSLFSLSENSKVAEQPPEDDEDQDGAEASAAEFFGAVAGCDSTQKLAQLVSLVDGHDYVRMTRTEGSNDLGAELHCVLGGWASSRQNIAGEARPGSSVGRAAD